MTTVQTYHVELGHNITISQPTPSGASCVIDRFNHTCGIPDTPDVTLCVTSTVDYCHHGYPQPGSSITKLRKTIVLLSEALTELTLPDSVSSAHYNALAFHISRLSYLKRLYKNRRVTLHCIKQEIRTNIKQVKSVAEVAASLGVCERQIYLIFKNEANVTPLQYMQELKLSLIEEELKMRGTRTITEIATDYGFTNMGRFSALYRKKTGVLPSAHTA